MTTLARLTVAPGHGLIWWNVVVVLNLSIQLSDPDPWFMLAALCAFGSVQFGGPVAVAPDREMIYD